jgi:O-antigen/teichoic acid export membrane protein
LSEIDPMSLGSKVAKGGLQVALGTIGQQVLQFVRSAVIARMLPTEQFGIALTFLAVLAALEAFTELGLELFMIRTKNIEDERLQRTAHLFSILRGALASIVMYFLAGPIASLFDVPDSAWAYQWLALAPLLRSFMHFDFIRYQRQLNYWPNTVVTFASFFIGTAVAIIAAYVWRDSFSIVLGAICQVVTLVIGSHLVAERSYGLSYVKEHAREILSFGLPMLFNASVLFALYQGDRVAIASLLGVNELVVYGTVAILTSAVMALVSRVTGALYLPLLAEHAPDTSIYRDRFAACGVVASLAALATTIPFAFIGVELTKLAFGGQFNPPAFLVLLLAAQGGLKVIRNWTQQAFIATAQLFALVISNLVSATGLGLAVVAVKLGYGVEGVAISVLISELLAAAVSIAALRKYPGLSMVSIKYFALTIFACLPLLWMTWLNVGPQGYLYEVSAMIAYLVLCFAIVMALSPTFKEAAMVTIRKFRSGAKAS